jgi:hypothetical protein
MQTIKISDQLADIRGRIDRLRAFEHAGGTGARARIGRHLDALREEEVSVQAALLDAPDEVEARLGELRARLYVSEHGLAADLSDAWPSFASGVEAELRRWDDYLERLQATAAAKAPSDREQSEAAIGLVRSCRIHVGERLAQARALATDAPEDARRQVNEAREALERQAGELPAPPTRKPPRPAAGETDGGSGRRRQAPRTLALRCG